MSKITYFIDPLDIEAEAQEQINQTASMPFVQGVAVMPDVHAGRGSTVGTVVVTKGAVMPACVGVDIGCGMIAVKTSLTVAQIMPHLRALREGIERRIPLGIGPFGMNSRILPSAQARIEELEVEAQKKWDDVNFMNQRAKDWRNQVGSLGGGNHFIEICEGTEVRRGDDGEVWIEARAMSNTSVWVILHSGSRAVGNKTGTHWTKVAQKQAEKYAYKEWLPHTDLAYLVEHSEEYWQYMSELYWCQKFALLNREEMMDRVLLELAYTIGSSSEIEVERINCHHNFTQKEYHFGHNVLVTRKGAIHAPVGAKALIPGSMGAQSYIVEGLGNAYSYSSAPHGAGRRMSRTKARKEFTEDQLRQLMQDMEIEARVRPQIVDEHPGAYKDIDEVMENAKSLVAPTYALRQLINVKGD